MDRTKVTLYTVHSLLTGLNGPGGNPVHVTDT